MIRFEVWKAWEVAILPLGYYLFHKISSKTVALSLPWKTGFGVKRLVNIPLNSRFWVHYSSQDLVGLAVGFFHSFHRLESAGGLSPPRSNGPVPAVPSTHKVDRRDHQAKQPDQVVCNSDVPDRSEKQPAPTRRPSVRLQHVRCVVWVLVRCSPQKCFQTVLDFPQDAFRIA